MKKIVCFIVASFFTFSFVSAQANKNHLPPKASEQHEISADKRLEKEMQQKQLSAKPEQLEEVRANRVEARTKSLGKQNRKGKYQKSNCVKKS